MMDAREAEAERIRKEREEQDAFVKKRSVVVPIVARMDFAGTAEEHSRKFYSE